MKLKFKVILLALTLGACCSGNVSVPEECQNLPADEVQSCVEFTNE